MVSRKGGCSELNGSSHQSEVQLLVGRGCWSLIFCWFVPNRSRHAQDDRVAVMVTMVTAMPDHRRCENCAEVELA